MIDDKGSVCRLGLDKMFLLVLCCIIINCDFLKGESYLQDRKILYVWHAMMHVCRVYVTNIILYSCNCVFSKLYVTHIAIFLSLLSQLK